MENVEGAEGYTEDKNRGEVKSKIGWVALPFDGNWRSGDIAGRFDLALGVESNFVNIKEGDLGGIVDPSKLNKVATV